MGEHILTRAKIIDGKAFAANLRTRIQHDVVTLNREYSVTPGLAVLLVGEDAASQVYVRSKRKQTAEVGMNSFAQNLPTSTSQSDLLARVDELNADSRVNGILVQLPLPPQISDDAVINAVDPHKDVDGFNIVNTGRMWSGGEALVPCTPLGCSILLKDRLGDLSGLNVVVVGRSNIVGKPMASLLIRENCTVTIAHSRTRNLPAAATNVALGPQ
jgi:methylenetetrahydrofolate dehydrogenase (NADP+)/methenyltetrahydrofolate cyclohydrolase